jgi:hypothetical protein
VLVLGAALSACSEIYYDRRETVSLGAGEGVATNKVTHMVDPWPRHSANNQLAFDGERMQSAVQRYRRHEVIQPRSPTTTNAMTDLAPTTTEAIQTTRGPPAAPAAAVRGP